MYTKYNSQGLEILAFPSNQFGGQEPGSAAQIQDFCEKNHGVTFPLMEKGDMNGKVSVFFKKWTGFRFGPRWCAASAPQPTREVHSR